MADFDLTKFPIKKAEAAGTPKSILVYGPPKKGKTVMACSIVRVPGFERTLLIDVEGGASSVSEWYPEIDVIEASTPDAFIKIGEALLNGKLLEPVSGLPYQAVIIDTIDKAQERQLEAFKADPRSMVNGKEDGFWKWGMLKAWTTKIADKFHMADFLTIFIAHEDDHKDEGTGKETTTVYLQGKSRLTFPATPDIIGRYTVEKIKNADGKPEMKRVIDFSLSDKLITGQRYAEKLNGKFVEPDFDKIFRLIDPNRYEAAGN